MWWHWQKRDPKKRLQEVNGPTTQRGTENVTLDFVPDHAPLGTEPPYPRPLIVATVLN
jgi:tyrosinase